MTLKPILAALLVATALPAAAQTAPAPDGAPMMRRDPAMMQQRRAGMRQHFAEMERRHADDLALLLDLKPAQRPALDAFLKSSHPGMGDGAMTRRPEGPPAERAAPSFTQRLDRMDEMAARRADAEHRRIAATKAFYQSLDPHQQQLFDALMRMRHGGGGHGRMGRGGMGGGGMHGARPGGPGGPGPMARPAPQD